MNKNFLSFDEYTMLNESFKSKIISRLFQEGEINTKDVYQKALFNQVTDDEVIGVANDEEEAKKMLHDTLGDKKVIKYRQQRITYHSSEDDWDDDWVDDHNSPYTFNKTVEGYVEWIFKLNSGKFLVLRIEKNVLDSRLHKIRDPRYSNKADKYRQSEFRKKFQKRKEYVEKNKENIEKYWKFKKLFEENGLWDEFVKKMREKLSNMVNEIEGAEDFESFICSCEDGRYDFEDDSIKFEIGEFSIELSVDGEYNGTIRYWDEPGDYWTAPAPSKCEFIDGEMNINSISIYVDGPEEFEFTYLSEFDKDVDLCDFDYFE